MKRPRPSIMASASSWCLLAPILLVAAAPVCHAGSTITVTTSDTTIDFAPTGTSATTLVRPSWDMTVQTSTNQPSPSAGVWVPGSGSPTVAQLLNDLATRGDGLISLPEAIAIANATQYIGTETGPTTIVFAPGITAITLTQPDNWWYGPNGLPPIYSNLVIDGGASGVTIERSTASGTANFRLLYVAGKFHNLVEGKAQTLRPYTQGQLTLRNITLSNGLAHGGEAAEAGAGAGLGGAIYNQGLLTLDHAALSNNVAHGGGSADFSNGYFAGGGGLGAGGFGSSGGGFRYVGVNMPVSTNQASIGGGFLSQLPRAEGGDWYDEQSGTNGTGNGGISFFGGNGHKGGVLDPNYSAVCTMFAGGGGFISDASGTGGVRGDGGGFSRHCQGGGGAFGGGGGTDSAYGGAGGVGGGGTVESDGGFGGGGGYDAFGGFGGGSGADVQAWGFGGGAGYLGGTSTGCNPICGGGGAGFGGAVFNHTGSLTIQNGSMISGNSAIGGQGYGGGAGYGGGVFNLDGTVLIDGSTISANTVTGGTAFAGQTGLAAGGAVYNRFQSEDVGVADLLAYRGVPYSPSLTAVTLRNATLSGSVGGVDCFTDGGKRQESGTDEAYAASLHFQGSNTIGTDAAGINACGNFNHRGVRFTFSLIDDSAGDFNAQGWLAANSLFQQNLQAAAALWANEFDVDGVDLRVEIVADNSVASMSGTFYNGWNLGPWNSYTQLEPSALSKMRVGASPVVPYDIIVSVNTAFVVNNYWIDPTPTNRNDNAIPTGKTDLVSIVLHEFEHGLGMEGFRSRANDSTFGTFPQGYVNPFDTLTSYNATNGPFFIGANGETAYSGNPVPLTYWPSSSSDAGSDFYHFSTCANRYDTTIDRRLRYALMSDCSVPTNSTYNIITPLDRAVLRDMGYPLKIFHSGFEFENSDYYSGP